MVELKLQAQALVQELEVQLETIHSQSLAPA